MINFNENRQQMATNNKVVVNDVANHTDHYIPSFSFEREAKTMQPLRKAIHAMTGIQRERQVLVHNGHILPLTGSLAAYHLTSTIDVDLFERPEPPSRLAVKIVSPAQERVLGPQLFACDAPVATLKKLLACRTGVPVAHMFLRTMNTYLGDAEGLNTYATDVLLKLEMVEDDLNRRQKMVVWISNVGEGWERDLEVDTVESLVGKCRRAGLVGAEDWPSFFHRGSPDSPLKEGRKLWCWNVFEEPVWDGDVLMMALRKEEDGSSSSPPPPLEVETGPFLFLI